MDAKRIHFESMATLTIKNLPDEIYAALTRTAKRNRRSINGEAIVQLETSLSKIDPNVDKYIASIRERRECLGLQGIWVTEDDVNKAKNEGRP